MSDYDDDDCGGVSFEEPCILCGDAGLMCGMCMQYCCEGCTGYDEYDRKSCDVCDETFCGVCATGNRHRSCGPVDPEILEKTRKVKKIKGEINKAIRLYNEKVNKDSHEYRTKMVAMARELTKAHEEKTKAEIDSIIKEETKKERRHWDEKAKKRRHGHRSNKVKMARELKKAQEEKTKSERDVGTRNPAAANLHWTIPGSGPM